MQKQTRAFLDGVGDDYFLRNIRDFGRDGENDSILQIIDRCRWHFSRPLKNVLEIGCANGWRLKFLREKYGWDISGIDPSRLAILEGNNTLGVDSLKVGTADSLPWPDHSFDVVIMGFFLWQCEPESWFQIVAESNRVLANGGYLVILDYVTPRIFTWKYAPETATNREQEMTAYSWDWQKLWLCHPSYNLIADFSETCTLRDFRLHRATTLLHKAAR